MTSDPPLPPDPDERPRPPFEPPHPSGAGETPAGRGMSHHLLVATPRPPPAVVASSREEMDRRRRAAQLRKAPLYLAIAALLHAAGLWYWFTRPVPPGVPEPDRRIRAEALEEAPPPIETPPPKPPEITEVPDVPEVQDPIDVPVETDLADETAPAELPAGPDMLGLGGGAGGGGRGGHRSGMAGDTAIPEIGSLSGSGFRSFVDDLRGRGLDVVFVIDATQSMQPFIDKVRETVDDIIADLSAIVPDLRLGIVAYRDRTDSWLTRRVDLTEDRYRIHNFLLGLEAVGGGDFEEAVEEGLRVAAEDFAWRPGARRVMILVGDAPPHPADEGKALTVVRNFAREKQAAVSVLYTGISGSTKTDRDKAALQVFERIARTGGGLVADLGEGDQDLRDRILDASFGTEWRDEIRDLLTRRQSNLRDRIVARKVAGKDRKWLLKALGDDPVHPGVVDGCARLFDGAVAARARDLLLDEKRSTASRSAMLYLLKKGIGATLDLDIDQPLAEQAQAVARIKREVDRIAPPPPRPAPATPPPPPPR